MGLFDLFYPNRPRQLRPKYRKHCNCDECVSRSHSYGEMWRHQTPVCSCCDCMAMAGENVPHTHSTYAHTHAARHTCAMQGPIRHNPVVNQGCCQPAKCDPPPKYSLMPRTTHKVDQACGPRYYATPLFPSSNAQTAHQCGGHAPPTCPGHPQPQHHYAHDNSVYLRTPANYHPCNR
ncbi:hypothetical protein GGF43_003725 [Coemansia sp. RSA 2618]|nr:hypothetical protein GGF43_003725 [Coemansia sp. RSA 2618]